MQPRHRFVQRFRVEGKQVMAREERRVDSEDRAPHSIPALARVRAPLMREIKHVLSMLLRISGMLVFCSPLLWVMHLLARHLIGGMAIVLFVSFVVLFFALLNLYVLATGVVWLVDRKAKVGIPFDEDEDDTLPLEALHFAGTLRGVEHHDHGDILFRDAWTSDHRRIAEGDDVVVEMADGQHLILRFETCPELLGRGQRVESNVLSSEGRRMLALGSGERLRALTLRVGDEVDVYAHRQPESVALDGLQLGRKARTFHRREDSAYRGGMARADLLVCEPKHRVVIRKR